MALHRLGAKVTALDNSACQLEHASALMKAAGVDFPLVHANAESTGLGSNSFDVVFCDHGAMSFADPLRTIPEAARLLRPGGLLAFSMDTPILSVAWPPESDHPGDGLVMNYWELHAIDEPGHSLLSNGPMEHGYVCFGNMDSSSKTCLSYVRGETLPAAIAARLSASGPGGGRWSISGGCENQIPSL
jgi:SAM-dependent methyltransferase